MPQPNTNTDLGVGNIDIVYAVQNLGSTVTGSVTIASGSTVSTVFDLSTKTICGFQIPLGWDGGNISFQGSSASDGTYNAVFDSNGSQLSATVTTGSTIVSLVGNTLQGLANVPYVKVVSGSAVGANRTINILTKG